MNAHRTLSRSLLAAACAATLLMACNRGSDHEAHAPAAEQPAPVQAEHQARQKPEQKADEPADHHAGHGDRAAPGLKLTLDNGQKWPMDEHTRAALDGIEKRVVAGPATDDIAGHQALGAALDEDIQGLVRGCTMQGAAHDQLHVWLTAFIPATGALKAEADLDAARAKRKEIHQLVGAARAHFR